MPTSPRQWRTWTLEGMGSGVEGGHQGLGSGAERGQESLDHRNHVGPGRLVLGGTTWSRRLWRDLSPTTWSPDSPIFPLRPRVDCVLRESTP